VIFTLQAKTNSMLDFKTKILSILKDITGEGSFVSHRVAPFQFPGLEVAGIGEISYPINQVQVKSLIAKANKASFGKGSETILDPKVRSAWELEGSELNFIEDGWNDFLNTVLNSVKKDLGIESYEVKASLYKMLIYEEGDFFLSHKDSEKEKGMFGTLILGLPSRHTGGELLVRFDGKQESINFADATNNFKIPYVAFYADCEHEIKPITSGYRVCLVYNLVQQKVANAIKMAPLEGHVAELVELFKSEKYDPIKPAKIILLGHQYTPENFSMHSLKLNDRSKAEALIRAADKVNYYSKMALVTSYISGTPQGGGYYDDEIDENAKMEEVYDESLSIEHWMVGGSPSLNIQFEEEDLVASFHLADDEPIVKEIEGYMGNYGPDLMHWYHYGAVIVWPKTRQADLLVEQDTETKLRWISYYNTLDGNLTSEEILAVEAVLLSDLEVKSHVNPDYNPIVDWLLNKKDSRYFLAVGSTLLHRFFVKIDINQLVRLADAYPADFAETINRLISGSINLSLFEHFLALLNDLLSNPKIELDNWLADQSKTLPPILAVLIVNGGFKKPVIKKKTWRDLLNLDIKLPQSQAWVEEITRLVTTSRERNYLNGVLVPEILALNEKTHLSDKVIKICLQELQQRVNDKPQPPLNWSRALPDTKSHKGQWAILKHFLQSPDESIFEYKNKQRERDELENAINSVSIDLKFETIRKGSPYTLRITKTQAAYQKEMQIWDEDVVLLIQLKGDVYD